MVRGWKEDRLLPQAAQKEGDAEEGTLGGVAACQAGQACGLAAHLSFAVRIFAGESPNLAWERADRVKPVGCATPQVDAERESDYN